MPHSHLVFTRNHSDTRISARTKKRKVAIACVESVLIFALEEPHIHLLSQLSFVFVLPTCSSVLLPQARQSGRASAATLKWFLYA